jgi:asparagine synthase (glutamine-hydrolysing)
MCGIAGCLDLADRQRATRAVAERMSSALAHRGPDSDGYLVERELAIGFRRLAILDLVTGDQPITGEDSTVAAFCNGEIFNHEKLRAKLAAAGHRFRTRSDTEVLVHLYEDLGTNLLDELNGQFALAIYDRVRRRLLLARDHVGIAPLFYTIANGQLVFGSEIKAILRHPAVSREVDLRGLDQVISLPGLVSPRTMFTGIHSLPAGHFLLAESGRIHVSKYWDLDYPPDGEYEQISAEEHLCALDRALTDAVGMRMRADVPYGCYLSGGLDSSLIASLASSLASGSALATFSAVLSSTLSEVPHQRFMARTLGAAHTEVPVGPETLLSGLPRAVYHSECPLKESYNVASIELSAAVRDAALKFVLSGEGADELFAGYVGYKFDRMRASAPACGRALTTEERSCARLSSNTALLYGRREAELTAVKRALYSPAAASQLADHDYRDDLALDRDLLTGRHILHQRSYLDFKLRLADHLLGDHGDRMALANSVEARYPFLDRDVIECARRMPPELKLNGYQEKYAVKQVAEDRVPARIIEREKFAFQANGSPDLLRLDAAWLNDLLSPARARRDGFFAPDAAERLRNEYLNRDIELLLIAQDDVLMVMITFGLFLEAFDLPFLR